jgi:hypothetical protein
MNTQEIYEDLLQSESLGILENNTYKEINHSKQTLLDSINDFFNRSKLSNEDIMDMYDITFDVLNKIRFNKEYLLDLSFLSGLEEKILHTLDIPDYV